MKRVALVSLMLIFVVSMAKAELPAFRYEIIDLGCGSEGHEYDNVWAQEINNRGIVAGKNRDTEQLVIWENEGSNRQVIQPPWAHFYIKDTNELGQIVGYYQHNLEEEQVYAYIWDPIKGFIDLGTLTEDFLRAAALHITNYGLVLGDAGDMQGYYNLFLYNTHTDRMRLMRRTEDITALDMNEFGDIAGGVGREAAVIHLLTRRVEILEDESNDASVKLINNTRQVAGTISPGNNDQAAMRAENGGRRGTMVPIWPLDPDECTDYHLYHNHSVPLDMNEDGVIVGYVRHLFGQIRWKEDWIAFDKDTVYDIECLLTEENQWDPRQMSLLSINDHLQIVGRGWNPQLPLEHKHPILLNPVWIE